MTDIRFVNWSDAPPKGDAADFTGSDTELRELLESAKPLEKVRVDLGEPLNDTRALLTKYVVLSPHQADTVTLWVAHTHVFGAAETTPYLSITSAEKRSGKTRLLEVLDLLVHEPWSTGRTTPAALARKVDKLRPTLLLDEMDALFKGDKEFSETLRGMLNSGHRYSGTVTVCTGVGASMDFKDFSTFCPKALSGIGDLPDTVSDRSIRIVLKRRSNTEHVARFRQRDAVREATPIRRRLETWAASALDSLREARPDSPDELSDRAADGWEPLFAIADLAGGEWAERARLAAVGLSDGDGADDQSVGVRLLADIETVFSSSDGDQMSTADLLKRLIAIEESPWGEWHGKPITAYSLAKLLRPFSVRPRTIRVDNQTPKGYRRKDLIDAWARYTPNQSATPPHSTNEFKLGVSISGDTGNVADSVPAATQTVVTESENKLGVSGKHVADVADRIAPHGGKGAKQGMQPADEINDLRI